MAAAANVAVQTAAAGDDVQQQHRRAGGADDPAPPPVIKEPSSEPSGFSTLQKQEAAAAVPSQQPAAPARQRGGRVAAHKQWSYPGLAASSSYQALTTIGATHQFSIQGYALMRSLGCGARICSDVFDAAGQAFRLEIFPAGISADCTTHIGAFLTTPGAPTPGNVLHEIAVIDQSGGSKHLARASQPGAPPTFAPEPGVVAGYPRFVRAAALEAHPARYLAGDQIVFRVTVELVRSWSYAPRQLLQPGALFTPPIAGFQARVPADGRVGRSFDGFKQSRPAPCFPGCEHAEQQDHAAKMQADAARLAAKGSSDYMRRCFCSACCCSCCPQEGVCCRQESPSSPPDAAEIAPQPVPALSECQCPACSSLISSAPPLQRPAGPCPLPRHQQGFSGAVGRGGGVGIPIAAYHPCQVHWD